MIIEMANKIVVAGGGASGLTAAIFAAENGAEVTILEHKDRVGKKILMTGNGKCNLTNMNDMHGKYYSSDTQSLNKIYHALARFDAERTRGFFQKLGLYTKEKKDGGVYPVSEQASIVLDVLRSECSRLGVQIQTDCEITSIVPEEIGGTVCFIHSIRESEPKGQTSKKDSIIKKKKQTIRFDALILATGGKAAPISGSDGSGYQLAKTLGHHIIEPLPALVQIKCTGGFFKSISGVRVQSRLKLYIEDSLSAEEEGELQITDYGISGIPVFQFSRQVSRALYERKKCIVCINFLSYLVQPEKEITAQMIKPYAHKTVEEFLSGLVHKKLSALICRQNGISSQITVGKIGIERVRNCIRQLADFRVEAASVNSFENAQVCCGGIPLWEVDEHFRSTQNSHVYIVGELLDCDGICGGYNLQWAWTTGAIAGIAASTQEKRK